MIRKQAGDEIANLFNKLMSKNIEKKASKKEESDCSYSHDGDVSSMAADMMLSNDDEVRHNSVDAIDNAKDSLHKHHGYDKKMASLMSGLGKIAASLRSDGEDFAADVVEATAISISKENASKTQKTASVVSELKKISSELREEDRFAADLVDSTINKITS